MCKIAEFSISQRGLVAVQNLKKEQAIIEYRGRFMTLSQFKEQYPFFRIRYFPFVLFHKPQADEEEICVDAREYGNAARFIRRSCTPNAKVRHVIQNGLLHLYIFSSKDIKKDQEITIPFDFDYQENNLTVDCPCGKQNCAVTSLVSPKDKQNTECSSLDNTPKRKTRKNSVYIENQSQSKDAVLDTSVSLTHKGTPLKNCAAISLPQDENTLTEVSLVKDETGEVKQDHVDPTDQCVESRKKMTREERKLDAIMRAFERMEKSQKKKQQAREKISLQKPHKQQTVHDEDKTKHHLNGEEEESTPVCENKYDVKRDQFNGDGLDNEEVKPVYYSPPIQHAPPYKRGKKRRSSGSATRRRIRTSSGGSEILSPDEGSCAPMDHFPNAAVTHPCGTLISPDGRREGFVLPKSKRFLMNEWIQEKAEASVPVSCPLTIHTELSWDLSTASPTCYVSCTKDATSGSGILAAHLRRNSNSGVSSKQISSIGSAKKRWLRQAMCETLPQDIEGTDGHESETSHCSPVHNGSMSPNPQSEASSPCLSPSGDVLTPLKKRRMMRASKDSTCSPILDDHPQVSSPESSFGTLRESFKPTLCGIKRLASDCSEHLTNKLPGKWLDKEANVKRELRLEKPGEENSVGPSLLTNCAAISQVSSGTESSQDSCKCLDLSCDVHGVIADSTTATAVDGVRSDVCNSLEKVLEAYNTSVGEADDTLWQSVDRPAACISGENMSKCDFSRDDKCLSTKYDNAGAENISLSLKDTGEKISVCVSPNACYVQETKISAKSDFLEICYTDHNCSSGVDEYVTSSVTPITSKIVSLCSISSSDVISSDTSSSVLSHPIESVSSSQDLPATTKTRSHKTGQKRKVSLSEYRMRKRENTKNESNNLKLETHGKRDFQNNEANDTGLLPLAQFEPLLAQDATEIDFKDVRMYNIAGSANPGSSNFPTLVLSTG
ncbi:histone-lysine N-methyltransferase 2E-like isoform X2 [Limulus polyphemus]|uniref:Histone-lysine N-methyltransferase 2E-like isoform X2 n=1 Tax=Limulus polyphemus TaxID=6850 RepID=A0ABM1BYN9_LIMPO|nr:histone-lysine N-methyltransferase 2E-like isoform X2 [Limulus polyphemus]